MLRAISEKDRWSHAASNVVRLVGLASFLLLVLILNDDNVAATVRGDQGLPPDRPLKLTDIGFRDGLFYQIVEPEDHGEPILADWTASIFLETEAGRLFICGDGGNGSYKPRLTPAFFDPDDWTGDDCSGLVEGREYVARAQWSQTMTSGRKDSLTTEFHFVFERVPE